MTLRWSDANSHFNWFNFSRRTVKKNCGPEELSIVLVKWSQIGSIAQYTQYTIHNYTGQLPFHTEWDPGSSLWECTSQHDPPTAIRLQVAWSNPNDQKQGNDHLRFVNKKCFFRSKSIFEKKLSIWTMEPAICDLHLCDLHLWNSMPEWAIYMAFRAFSTESSCLVVFRDARPFADFIRRLASLVKTL